VLLSILLVSVPDLGLQIEKVLLQFESVGATGESTTGATGLFVARVLAPLPLVLLFISQTFSHRVHSTVSSLACILVCSSRTLD
jgi:hypothetical protein